MGGGASIPVVSAAPNSISFDAADADARAVLARIAALPPQQAADVLARAQLALDRSALASASSNRHRSR